MDTRALYQQMAHYHQWREALGQKMVRFEQWIENHGLVSDEVRQCLKGARRLLANDGFNLVCVGEFSRGKTELINALLMGEQAERILPSQPGRTTMCPTEIYCDPLQPNCVRLLPIETRRSQVSLSRFKRIPRNWITVPFDPTSPDQLRAAIGQISSNRWVSFEEARELGFEENDWGDRNAQGQVAIPNWRHAMVSLDHPLLRRGLRIIDTPGLNALGNEPELTLKVLPEAQAIIFMLSADAGVTASDMTLWQEHVQDLTQSQGTAVLALLNKIDSLWDDLHPPEKTEQTIRSLCELTAQQLGLDQEQVLPVSAKQALLARARKQPEALARSGFGQLEQALADTVERNRVQLTRHRLIVDSQAMISNVHSSLKGRLADAEQELLLIRATDREDNTALLERQRDTIRKNHKDCHKQALSLRTSQMLLEKQKPALMQVAHPQRLKQAIERTQRRLHRSWTTVGLSQTMGELFEWLEYQMDHLESEVERANRVLASIYARPEHGAEQIGQLEQHQLDVVNERRKLRQLHKRADQFRASLGSVLSIKGQLIHRFINTLVAEARDVWAQLNRKVSDWPTQALVPLFQANQYQRQLLEHHMLRLTRLRREEKSQAEQIKTLRINIEELQLALAELEPLLSSDAKMETSASGQTAPTRTRAPVVSLDDARTAQVAG